jgi:hypothetical protein
MVLCFIMTLGSSIMVRLGAWETPIMPILSGSFGLLLGLILLIIWALGWSQIKKIEDFLASNRPLIRWTYTPEEWEELKKAKWEEEKGDWKIQLGCLTFLFGLAGLLAGLLIAASESSFDPYTSIGELILGGLSGAAIGAGAGGAIGLAVAGGNYLAARKAYHQPTPGQVALSPTEIYANDQYFKANGGTIESVEFQPETPAQLTIVTYTWYKRPQEEEWDIFVPPRLIKAVQAIIPQIMTSEPELNNDQG